MKHHIEILAIVVIAYVLGFLCGAAWAEQNPATMDRLLDAIEQVESGGNPRAVGDNGKAVGAYQIWKICVDDCNRIVGRKRWTLEDRWDRVKSREMCRTYLTHYGGTTEEMARKWNGGPRGHTKAATLPYWAKIKKELK